MNNELLYAKFIIPYMMTIGCWLAFGKFVAGLVFIIWSALYLFIVIINYVVKERERKRQEHLDKLAQSSHLA